MKFVTDVARHKWVIFAENRKNYVRAIHESPQLCPFCPEQAKNHKELFQLEGIRAIANDFPRVGLDEVIITPDHYKDIDEMPTEQIINLLRVFCERFNYHQKNGKVFIFQNHDLYAGASIPHPHSQLIVIPFDVPVEPSLREPVANIIMQTGHFVAYCPEFSQWPYEVWVSPLAPVSSWSPAEGGTIGSSKADAIASLQHDNAGGTFGSVTDKEIIDLASVLQRVLKAMVVKFEVKREMAKKGIGKEFPYNFYIYYGDNWYLRIIPRLMRHGGFELSTGLHINTVDPATAAKEYVDCFHLR